MKLDKNSLKNTNFQKGKGCEECHNSGFKGRLGIMEIFMLTENLQDMIFKEVSSYRIKEEARRSGMKTLREDGIRKVMAGLTTLEEVVGVSVEDI
jgi:general secretion pathway protein E/type IV pilus assembly protein PilB